jgi:predicted lipoprotein with Yx(FWY)xxD motif
MIFTTRKRAATAGALAAAGLLALAACGSSSGSGGSTPSGSSTTSASSTAVHTVKDATLGTIVVNGKGFTLYRFDMDSAKPSASHCTGACATAWPAAPATAANSVQGVDHKLIGSVTGTSGSKQLTVGGWPVYTYSQDSKAGDTHGQGVGGTWFAVTPTGGKAAATSTSPTSPSGGGYGY